MKLPRLRFGIPSLDSLFGSEREGYGLGLPDSNDGSANSPETSISICVSGPDGTGKSILGLHLAARYLADCAGARVVRPKILYISTDLKYGMAAKVWRNFALGRPNARTIPFEREETGEKELEVELIECSPLKVSEDGKHLSRYLHGASDRNEIYFVDLASSTAGDDWGFVNRTLSTIENPAGDEPRHLMVVDSIEGFETLVGERDAFGQVRERRSRVAQMMRAAGEKCHMLFIVEEPKVGERLPEDFIADVVIRLRSQPVRNYIRRTIEIEKARGQSHVRGQHIYLIRSGTGSTTGQNENPDDPTVGNVRGTLQPGGEPLRYQSYLHVCHSLHHSYRKVMYNVGRGRLSELPERFAAFGIRYLDEMLGTGKADFRRQKGDDQRGLPCSTTTALIGNAETQKAPLGVAFLSRCFREYIARFYANIEEMKTRPEAVRRRYNPKRLEEAKSSPAVAGWQEGGVERHYNALARLRRVHLDPDDRETGKYFEHEPAAGKGDKIDPLVLAAAWATGPPNFESDGIPVLLTTQDINAQRLALDFLPWLLRKIPHLLDLEAEHRGCVAALRILMEHYTVCRRLEIHDLPSAVFIHILQRAVSEARSILYGDAVAAMLSGSAPRTNAPTDASPDGEDASAVLRERVERSRMIRVVIDDFSILKDTYIEIREEPLLLRFIVFYLGQEGVTTLLIDTQPGRPDTTVSSPLHSELRSLVDNRIYTWRFQFYGENRVAVTVIPLKAEAPPVVRELRRGNKDAPGAESLPLVVDPHFELYNGIEQGESQPIPIEIWLFNETPAFNDYITEENLRYCDLFTPLPRKGDDGVGQVIVGVPSTSYDQLRDICFLQRDTRLEHTLVVQVDEFWMKSISHGVRRAGSFRPQWKYLNAIVAEKTSGKRWEPEWAADPFRLFQKTERAGDDAPVKESMAGAVAVNDQKLQHRRRDEFRLADYQNLRDNAVDRVPFMWDFGFLLCKARPWQETADEVKLSIWNSRAQPDKRERDAFKTHRHVWDALPKATKEYKASGKPHPSWRVFLEACYQLAQKQSYSKVTPVTPFGIYGASVQTLACLILEIWASEIHRREQRVKLNPKYDSGERSEAARRLAEFVKHVKVRRWRQEPDDRKFIGLIRWLEVYKLEFFKAWLLLLEVMDFHALAEVVKGGTFSNLKPDATALAVRHWYKTACEATHNFSYDDPVVPVSLPGHFSIRGDWFLAVAGGSRSGRLADRALDLLSSRRANYTRLKRGLGLPTRNLHDPLLGLSDPELRTSLLTLDAGAEDADGSAEEGKSPAHRISTVKYSNLLRIGQDEGRDFYWLWRSGLPDYDRHTKIWQDWLGQMILWWDRMRYVEKNNWVNGFERYDDIVAGEHVAINEKYAPTSKDGTVLEAWSKFENNCDQLVRELRQATLEL
ncbi:MAG TPA: ATPase domain-containing protein [Pyrinomonadaceae bacterium]|nr:ATPase domain-containing protein [Pyrinomonadaceae bacterium]